MNMDKVTVDVSFLVLGNLLSVEEPILLKFCIAF